ncbi:DUF6655 family protein [Planctomycetes bacterium TBK1r]|uniref:Lipoprotein n=1 Tax=Stieleria magnilauensis TaxID=2527963 RepID=A0ABX5XQD4_9BACT|nr:hypothetical protein TBK1r_30840 [Planctomycetes bacterium TBK1r]
MRGLLVSSLLILALSGCGTTRQYEATEQLVVSDAVDRGIQHMDFRPLSGRKVYLDSSYLRQVKSVGFVNAEYVISALRQQILAAGCLLQDSANESDVIIEARIGALGADEHQVTYGIPENNSLNSAANVIPGAPTIPTLPEISVARREAREAAAKIAAFAYDRETRKPIWQSGVRHSTATAKNTWVMGIGPFQGGSIREKTKLVGSGIAFGRRSRNASVAEDYERPAVDYSAETRFNEGWPEFGDVGEGHGMIASSDDGQESAIPTPPELEPADKPEESEKPDENEKPSEVAKAPGDDKPKRRPR